jgi:WD40 repeat protein
MSNDATVKCWNIDSGKCLKTIQLYAVPTSMAVNDQQLLTGYEDGTIKKHNFDTDEELSSWNTNTNDSYIHQLIVFDGYLYAKSTRYIQKWNLETNELITTIESIDYYRSKMVIHDGFIYFTNDGHEILCKYTVNGTLVSSFHVGVFNNDIHGYFTSIVIDGNLLYLAYHNNMIKTWDIDTGKCMDVFNCDDDFFGLKMDHGVLYSLQRRYNYSYCVTQLITPAKSKKMLNDVHQFLYNHFNIPHEIVYMITEYLDISDIPLDFHLE